MFLSNLPTVLKMFADLGFWRFSAKVHKLFASDSGYSTGKLWQMFKGMARGEKIVHHRGTYTITSYLPSVPSQAFLTFLRGGEDSQKLFTSLAYMRRNAPLSAYLCVTNRCLYDCMHCSAKLRRGEAELSGERWKRLITEIQDAGAAVIGFTGGEPILRPDIEELVSTVDSRSSTILFTSGRDFTLKKAKSLKRAGLGTLSVSLDSADPAKHNRMRGDALAFERALAAIRHSGQAGLYTMVQPVVLKSELSRDKLFSLFKLVAEHGAHEVRIHQPVPSGSLLDSPEAEDIFYNDKDREHLIDIQFAANRRFGFPKVSSFPYTESDEKFGCSAGMKHAYVTATGELYPCDFVPLPFGNVAKEGFAKVYGRMEAQMGLPRNGCWAIQVASLIRGKRHPETVDESANICSCTRSETYPGFFQDLQ